MSPGEEPRLELYHSGESFCSQKVRVALAEKGLEWESHHITLCDQSVDCQNLDAEYLRIHPKGFVPALVMDERVLTDSFAIIRELDEAYPDRGERLWPQVPGEREELSGWIREGSLLDEAGLSSSFGMAIPAITAPALAWLLKRQPFLRLLSNTWHHPVKLRRNAFLAMRLLGAPKALLRGAVRPLARGLVRIDHQLATSGGPWLLGRFRQIDIMLMACLHRIADVRLDAVLGDPVIPHVGGYWERLRSRPSYSAAILGWQRPEMRAGIEGAFARGNPIAAELGDALRSEAAHVGTQSV